MMYRLSMILGLVALVAACGQRTDSALWSNATPAAAMASPQPESLRHPDRIQLARGDTLYGIARRYGLPVRSIIDANNLTPPYGLNAGMMLTLPQVRQQIVQPGETLERVAQANGVDVSSLARTNRMSPPYTIRVGQALILPASAVSLASSRGDGAIAASPLLSAPAQKMAATTGTAAPLRIESDEVPPPDKPVQMAAATPIPSAPDAQDPSPVRAAASPLVPAPAPPAARFVWPVEGRVITSYGTEAGGVHNDGINIAAPVGTPVVAAAAGTVAYVGNELRGYGNLVLLKHQGGYLTAYAHNSTVLVHKGDRVTRGQTIARVGATGAVKEPQLHFEIRNGRNPVNPATLLPQMKQASAASG